MSLYYHDPKYVMMINEKQSSRIEHMIYVMVIDEYQAAKIDHEISKSLVTAKVRPIEYWTETREKFLRQHNARYGEVIKEYNPYVW